MKLKQKLVIALMSTAMMGSAMAAPAANPAAVAPTASTNQVLNIGVIDLAAVLQQSAQAKAAAEKLKADFKPRQDAIMAQEKQLQTDQQTFKRDGMVMAQVDAQALQDKMAREQRNLQQMQDDYMQDLRAAQGIAMQKVLAQIDQVVQKIAVNGHYDLILQRNTVAFNSPRVDITKPVIDALKGQ